MKSPKNEDDSSAQALKERALEQIGKARCHVEEAIATEQ
jgi:hypothetical protein